MTAETRDFPLAIVLSVTTGLFLCPKFSDIHECVEHVAGHSVWTHELADDLLLAYVRERIYEQHPGLRGVVRPEVDKSLRGEAFLAAVRPWLGAMADQHGTDIALIKGTGERTESPLQSLERMAPGKSVIVVDVGGDE